MNKTDQEKQRILDKLYHLWTSAIGTPNYKKEEWIELEKEINMLFEKIYQKENPK